MKNEVIRLDTIVVRPDYDDNETKKYTNSNGATQSNKYLLKVKFLNKVKQIRMSKI